MKVVNLAQRPFLNRRPLSRLAMLLWLLGALLLAFNLWLYWSHFSGSSLTGTKLAEINAELDQADAAYEQLEEQRQALQLRDQNRQVGFLNQLIAMRTFPWSKLFEDLEDVLPLDVRLRNVQPEVLRSEDLDRLLSTGSSNRRRSASSSGRRRRVEITDGASYGTVRLQIQGEAKSEEAMLDFWQTLFDSELFSGLELQRDSRQRDNRLAFTMGVNYLTEEPETPSDELSDAPDSAQAELEPGSTEPGAPGVQGAGASSAPLGGAAEPAVELVATEASDGVTITSAPASGDEPTPGSSQTSTTSRDTSTVDRASGRRTVAGRPTDVRPNAAAETSEEPPATSRRPATRRTRPGAVLPGAISVRPGVVGQSPAAAAPPPAASDTVPGQQAPPPATPGAEPQPADPQKVEPLQPPASSSPRLSGLSPKPTTAGQERSS